MLPRRTRCSKPRAMLVQRARVLVQVFRMTFCRNINVTGRSPVGHISVVTLVRTDTGLDQYSRRPSHMCVTVVNKNVPCMAVALLQKQAFVRDGGSGRR
jgi:hypothetical protein